MSYKGIDKWEFGISIRSIASSENELKKLIKKHIEERGWVTMAETEDRVVNYNIVNVNFDIKKE